jgi:hypothetical protein
VGPARGRPRYYERYREQQAPPNAHLYTFFIPPEYLQVIGRGREVEPDFEAFCTCLTRISGVSFDEAVEEHVASVYGTVPVRYMGLRALIRNKLAAARPKDLADVAALQRRQVP